MMTLTFTATEGGAEEARGEIVAGVCCRTPYQYLTFQRETESGANDCGIYFEFNDQINGAYDCIRRCLLSRERLLVELTNSLDPKNHVSTIDVTLKIHDEEFASLANALQRIFHAAPELLTVAR